MNTILITGATGTNGKALIKELTKRDAKFKIASRNPDTAKSLIKSDQEFVYFDFEDLASYESAVSNVDTVFLLAPPLDPNAGKKLVPFIDFLREKGIKRVLYLSGIAAEKMNGILDFHPQLEKKLHDENFDYTIIRAAFFAQNFKNYEAENILDRGTTYMPAGDGKAAFVDVEDIAEANAIILTQPGHEQKTYEFTGPTSLAFSEVATMLTEVIGKNIFYPNPSPEEFKATIVNSGAPEFIADYMNGVYSPVANNEVNYVSNDLQQIINRPPTPLKTVLERDF